MLNRQYEKFNIFKLISVPGTPDNYFQPVEEWQPQGSCEMVINKSFQTKAGQNGELYYINSQSGMSTTNLDVDKGKFKIVNTITGETYEVVSQVKVRNPRMGYRYQLKEVVLSPE